MLLLNVFCAICKDILSKKSYVPRLSFLPFHLTVLMSEQLTRLSGNNCQSCIKDKFFIICLYLLLGSISKPSKLGLDGLNNQKLCEYSVCILLLTLVIFFTLFFSSLSLSQIILTQSCFYCSWKRQQHPILQFLFYLLQSLHCTNQVDQILKLDLCLWSIVLATQCPCD